MFIVSEKKTPHGLLLVITDLDIIGKKFEQGKLQLDLTKEFYKGQQKSENEVKGLLFKARYVHFTGERAISLGIETKLIDTEKILHVAKIPHAEVVVEG